MTTEAHSEGAPLQTTGVWQKMATAKAAETKEPECDLPQVLEQLRLSINRLIQRQEALERAVGAMGALCACRAQPGPQP